MKNLSLDQYYSKIKRKITTVGGFTENKYITSIIRACRLKPITVFSNSNDKLLEDIWIDEFENSIEIKNKKLKIKLSSHRTIKICTDIFRNELPSVLAGKSSMACIGINSNDKFILVLVGSDKYLRCYDGRDNVAVISSPLIIGLRVLKYCLIDQSEDLNKLLIKSEFKHLHDFTWFTVRLPANESFLTYTNNQQLRNILYNGQ